MRVCGIDISGKEIRLVVLEGDKSKFNLININPRKMTFPDDKIQKEVQAFKETIFAYMRENQIDNIAIKQRNKKGKFSGGPAGFKIEGLIQLYDGCVVTLVSPAAISACIRKNRPVIPETLLRYQDEAFETAYKTLL